jgi:hypothetical protein
VSTYEHNGNFQYATRNSLLRSGDHPFSGDFANKVYEDTITVKSQPSQESADFPLGHSCHIRSDFPHSAALSPPDHKYAPQPPPLQTVKGLLSANLGGALEQKAIGILKMEDSTEEAY